MLGTADALNRSADIKHDPDDIVEFEHNLIAIRDALDSTAFDAAWDVGQGLSLEQAVALALDEM